MSKIGIMDPAFFVGKAALLKWLNDFFHFGYTKVEQTASGAAHCQILDAIFPGKVPLHKVNFHAKYDYEFVKNYKILQTVFDKEQIIKHVPVEKLIKAKYQDNLEFLQWIKNFFDTRYGGQEYDAVRRRQRCGKAYQTSHKHSGRTRKKTTEQKSAPLTTADPSSASTSASTSTARTGAARRKPVAAARRRVAANQENQRGAGSTCRATNTKQLASLNSEIAQLRVTADGLEKERNFYFGKLREIEILCQTDGAFADKDQLKEQVLKILYHTDEDSEFQSPDDNADGPAAAVDGDDLLLTRDTDGDDSLLAPLRETAPVAGSPDF